MEKHFFKVLSVLNAVQNLKVILDLLGGETQVKDGNIVSTWGDMNDAVENLEILVTSPFLFGPDNPNLWAELFKASITAGITPDELLVNLQEYMAMAKECREKDIQAQQLILPSMESIEKSKLCPALFWAAYRA